MKIIDARSGIIFDVPGRTKTIWVADPPTIDYGEGDSITIHEIMPGFFRSYAIISEHMMGKDIPARRVRLTDRWFHSSFPGEHVAFINT